MLLYDSRVNLLRENLGASFFFFFLSLFSSSWGSHIFYFLFVPFLSYGVFIERPLQKEKKRKGKKAALVHIAVYSIPYITEF